MKRFSFFASLVLALLVSSCSKDNESDLDNNTGNTGGTGNGCDTANMKFATNIKPILQANCYSCHSNATYAGISGVPLEDYADVKEHADAGQLMGVITHAAGYPPMPKGGGKLSDCNINKIQAWINRGAENN